MAINTDIATISQNPAMNGPDGSTDIPSVLDDAQRYALSFTAKLRDGVGFSVGAIVTALGFTPVQQGGGTGQGTQKIYIGYLGTQLGLQIDGNNFGGTWPIGITGNAATATNATAAGNSSQLGGLGAVEYVTRNTANTFRLGWNGSTAAYVWMDGAPRNVVTDWSVITSRPTDLASFTNSPGYVLRISGSRVEVGAPDNSGVIGRAIPNTDNRLRQINVDTAALTTIADGASYYWQINVSDARLKKDVAPTVRDSLGDVCALQFVGYTFNDVAKLFAGIKRNTGVLAQQAEQINPDWVESRGDYKQLNLEAMLMSALHAVQQLSARVAAMEAAK